MSPLQVDDLPLAAIGPLFEKNAVFPAKTNTEFVEVSSVMKTGIALMHMHGDVTAECLYMLSIIDKLF